MITNASYGGTMDQNWTLRLWLQYEIRSQVEQCDSQITKTHYHSMPAFDSARMNRGPWTTSSYGILANYSHSTFFLRIQRTYIRDIRKIMAKTQLQTYFDAEQWDIRKWWPRVEIL